MNFCISISTTLDGVDFVCAYFDEPDKSGHVFGPDSPEVALAVKRMDDVIGEIMDQVQKDNLGVRLLCLLLSCL